jgi:hypothetical protein
LRKIITAETAEIIMQNAITIEHGPISPFMSNLKRMPAPIPIKKEVCNTILYNFSPTHPAIQATNVTNQVSPTNGIEKRNVAGIAKIALLLSFANKIIVIILNKPFIKEATNQIPIKTAISFIYLFISKSTLIYKV